MKQLAFTIAQGKQVFFSQGNLQYKASTDTWRFAEHQWEIVGKDNENISRNYDGWIDLFGWGTSGYKDKMPYMTSTDSSDYGDIDNDIAGTNYDWGVYNKISNGGNQRGQWRTLNEDEWDYVINTRANAGNKKGVGCVNGINGLILLPDSWTLPGGLNFISGVASGWGSDCYKKVNNYSLDEWNKMEANGAVFLPTTGFRGGTYVSGVGSNMVVTNLGGSGVSRVDCNGCYWSSSYACYLYFGSGFVSTNPSDRYYGRSVRLVRDAE